MNELKIFEKSEFGSVRCHPRRNTGSCHAFRTRPVFLPWPFGQACRASLSEMDCWGCGTLHPQDGRLPARQAGRHA